MTEARWRLIADPRSVTIESDGFQVTANRQSAHDEFTLDETVLGASEFNHIENMVSELETMTRQTYGQFCGLARAIEVLGERWAMLIVRDLLVGPKTAAELSRGLPRIGANILSRRLKELEYTEVIRSRRAANPDEAVVYELTEFGKELDGIVIKLSQWGSRMLGEPRPGEIVTVDSLVLA
jgi:DNA-binding HxlR family transcriptional regulator